MQTVQWGSPDNRWPPPPPTHTSAFASAAQRPPTSIGLRSRSTGSPSCLQRGVRGPSTLGDGQRQGPNRRGSRPQGLGAAEGAPFAACAPRWVTFEASRGPRPLPPADAFPHIIARSSCRACRRAGVYRSGVVRLRPWPRPRTPTTGSARSSPPRPPPTCGTARPRPASAAAGRRCRTGPRSRGAAGPCGP